MGDQALFDEVTAEIKAVCAKLEEVEAEIKLAQAKHNNDEVAALRTKEEQLRKEKEQLRTKEEQLRQEKLLLLQRQPGALSLCLYPANLLASVMSCTRFDLRVNIPTLHQVRGRPASLQAALLKRPQSPTLSTCCLSTSTSSTFP